MIRCEPIEDARNRLGQSMLPGLKRPAIRLEEAGLQTFCMKLYFIPGAVSKKKALISSGEYRL